MTRRKKLNMNQLEFDFSKNVNLPEVPIEVPRIKFNWTTFIRGIWPRFLLSAILLYYTYGRICTKRSRCNTKN